MHCNALERGKDWRRNIVQNDLWSTRPVNFNLWSYILPSVEIFVVAGSILESAQAQRLHRQRRWRAAWRKLLSRCWTTTLTAQQSLTRLSPVKSSRHCWLHIRNLFAISVSVDYFRGRGGGGDFWCCLPSSGLKWIWSASKHLFTLLLSILQFLSF